MSLASLSSDGLTDLVRPLTRPEYDGLVEHGAFVDERIELLEGFLIEMTPEGPPHAHLIDRLNQLLVTAVGDRAIVRVGHPLALGDRSEPEPDLAVVPAGDYRHDHPAEALLVIETSRSSRRKDLGLKARLYAHHGIAEYWVVDLDQHEVVVHRAPAGESYGDIARHGSGSVLEAVALDRVRIPVTDILP